MTNCSKNWSSYAEIYNPIEVGSKDANDTEPHDNAIIRACNAFYHPNHLLTNNPETTLFIGRLDKNVTEKDLEDVFGKYGKLKNITVVRDVVTGYSKRYGFVEFRNKCDCYQARNEHQTVLKGKKILVEFECQHTLPGWIPRRLGGGFGGKKESGQLRFGCLDRPWNKRPVQAQLDCNRTITCDTRKYYKIESPRGHQNLHESASESKDRNRGKCWSQSKRSQSKRYCNEDSSEYPKRRKT